MNQNVVNVHTPDELDRILTADRTRTRRVVLVLESMEPAEQARWERRINSHYRACGCGSAALALVVAFLVGGAFAVFYHDLLLQRPLVVTGLGLFTLLASLGIGKTLGLWIARRQLRSTVSSLRRRLVVP